MVEPRELVFISHFFVDHLQRYYALVDQIGNQLLILFADIRLQVSENALCEHLKRKSNAFFNVFKMLALSCESFFYAIRPRDLKRQDVDLCWEIYNPFVELILLGVSIKDLQGLQTLF